MGGSGGPPSLATFLLEAELWKRLGLRREDLANRPWREVEEYITYIELIVREEQAARARQGATPHGR